MKVIVHDLKMRCPVHGEVPYAATSDGEDDAVTVYCPLCEDAARRQYAHPESPYPLQGTSPSIIEACNRGD